MRREPKLYMEPVDQEPTKVETIFKDLQRGLEELNPARQIEAQTSHLEQLHLESIRRKARMEAEGIAREEAMFRELAAVRQSAHRAEEREAAAHARARAAEEREQQNQAESAKRERFMVKITVASFIVACIGTAAAVIAIVVG